MDNKNYCWNCAGLIPLSTGRRKRHYCNDACRMAYKRKTEQIVTEHSKPNKVKGGTCWCCGDVIDSRLVCCQDCAWSGKAAIRRAGAYPPLLTSRTPDQIEADLHTLRPTGNHKMTAMERLFYRPGQTNFVSLPGRACYGVY